MIAVGVTPPKTKTLEAVRADATRVWIAAQTALRLKERAAALAAEAGKNRDLKAVAQKVGAPVLTGPPTDRRRISAIFSADLIKNIFEAPPGGIA